MALDHGHEHHVGTEDGGATAGEEIRVTAADTGADGRRGLGAAGERLAGEHLQRQGYMIVDRNYRTRWGELDLVAHARGVIAFVEVKTRRASARAGTPFEAVPARKRRCGGWPQAGWHARRDDHTPRISVST